MHVLAFNLATDADDPVLAFATDWINEIAARTERVTVVTMRTGRLAVAPNVTVHSVGKERGLSEPRRAYEFHRITRSLVRRDPPDVCFVHMIPVFAVLFAPLARRHRIPVLLWYAHGAVPAVLRVAERLVDRCVTSTPEGFRLRSRKLSVLQQGIDVGRFTPPETVHDEYERTVVSIGRLSPVKGVVEMVEAIAVARAAGADLRLELVGDPLPGEGPAYAERARQRAVDLAVHEHVSFRGPVPFHSAPDAYRRGGLFLNLSESGSFDKAILEAMAAGCIPLSSVDAFAAAARSQGWPELVTTRAEAGPQLAALAALDAERRRSLRGELRAYVAEEHGLGRLADRLVAELEHLTAGVAPASA